MSKARGKNTKPEVASTAGDVLVTLEAQGTNSDTLPFAEWSDQEINLEKWDATGKDKPSHLQQKTLFEDTQQVRLPPSVKSDCWKRCSEIFPNVNCVVFINKSTYPDLVKPNTHLFHSSFYRNFITSIEILLYLGCTRQIPEEYGSAGFLPSLGRPWRPWHHIYSNCKVVKGQSEHTPLYNSAGKYVVRLFWMGTWRKIYVDDTIPMDKAGNILLPSLYMPKQVDEEAQPVKSPKTAKSKGSSTSRKESIEIWPLILSKGLLKIASLCWSATNELNDFTIIQCLTGWVPLRMRTNDISSNEKWEILQAYVQHFEWDMNKKDVTGKKDKSSKKAETGGKKKKVVIPSGIENMQGGDYFVIASCNNFELAVIEEPRKVPHDIVIGLVRDIPLIKPPPRPDLEFWKTFRYEEWATEQGILSPDIKKMNIKSLNVVSPFQTLVQRLSTGDDGNESADLDYADKKSEASSKSSKKSSKSKGAKNLLEPDPSFWINFSELQDAVENITIYFQPRIFKSKAKISDINFLHKTDAFKQIINPIELHNSRNEPIYLFSDSIDAKFIVISYSQVGNVASLDIQNGKNGKNGKNGNDEISISSEHDDTNDPDVCINILLKKTKEDIFKNQSQLEASDDIPLQTFNLKSVNFLMEQYNWMSNCYGQAVANIQTVGSRSIILELKPGRSEFRLWISSHCSYVLQIFSDTPMTVGCLEEFYSACTVESQLLTNKCSELSSCFGKLVQAFGLPEYPKALENFYRVYKPTTHLNKKDLILMHKAFLNSLFEIITDSSNTTNRIEYVQLLLLQLKTFDYVSPYLDDTPHLCPSTFEREDQVIYAKIMERAATKIQAFFKGVYIRLQFKKMNEKHKDYMRIFETLKKLYGEIFSTEQRLTFCPKMFRQFFESNDMTHIRGKMDLYKDIESVFQTFNFSDTISTNSTEPRWLLMCRYDFHINSVNDIFIKISLFSGLSSYFVRVFDNDTQKEIKRYSNDVAVNKYTSNLNGYTILCYAWAENITKIPWKLAVVTQKMSKNNLIIFPGLPVKSVCLKNNYMATFDRIICRVKIRTASDAYLTAHITTSYDLVRLSFHLLDSTGNVISKSTGVGSVLLPLLYLKCIETTDTQNPSLNIVNKMCKDKQQIETSLSQITYSKLNKKYGSSDSLRSKSSKRKRSKGSASSEQETMKRTGSQDDSVKSDAASERSAKKSFTKLRSTEKLSQRSSTRSRNRPTESLSRLIETVETEYILEAKVIGDSWPLTASQWNRIQQIRESEYVYPPDNTMSKHKLNAKRPPTTTSTLERPFWVLDLVHGAEESLEFLEDTSTSEARREKKLKWFGEDKDRYRTGMELRNKFLEEVTVFREPPVLDKNTRTNNPEDFLDKTIKEFNVEGLFTKPLESIDEDTCKIKRPTDYITEEQMTEKTLQQYQNEEKITENNLQNLIDSQIGDLDTMAAWFNDIRADSDMMLEDAIKQQQRYLKKIEQETLNTKSVKKEKDEKKRKKK